jgi:ABC-type transport system substrate-binding protein
VRKPIVTGAEAIDAHTVQFTLKAPIQYFTEALGSAWCRIAAKHVLEKFGDLNRTRTTSSRACPTSTA